MRVQLQDFISKFTVRVMKTLPFKYAKHLVYDHERTNSRASPFGRRHSRALVTNGWGLSR
jgi:hypothetical protein